MADLEDAATLALSRLKDLEAIVGKAQAEMDSVEADVKRLGDELESEWSTFEEAAESLLQKARGVKASLGSAEKETAAAFDELHDSLVQASSDSSHELQAAAEELGGFEGQVRAATPEIASKGEEFAERTRALGEQAKQMAASLETAFGDVRDFLEKDVVDALEEMTKGVRDSAQDLREQVFEAAEEHIKDAETELDTYLDELQGHVAAALEDATQHAPAVVEYAMGQCEVAQDRAVEDVKSFEESLANVATQLETAIGDQERRIQAESGALQDTCNATDQQMATMNQALASVRDLLARFTFV